MRGAPGKCVLLRRAARGWCDGVLLYVVEVVGARVGREVGHSELEGNKDISGIRWAYMGLVELSKIMCPNAFFFFVA